MERKKDTDTSNFDKTHEEKRGEGNIYRLQRVPGVFQKDNNMKRRSSKLSHYSLGVDF